MRRFWLVCAGASVLAVMRLPAAAVEMQPGLWEQSTKVESDGAVSTLPRRTRCITATAVNAARDRTDREIATMVGSRPRALFDKNGCKVSDAKNSRDLTTWRLECAGNPSLEQEVTVRFDNPRHFVLVIRTSMSVPNKTTTSVLTTEGRHKGECTR